MQEIVFWRIAITNFHYLSNPFETMKFEEWLIGCQQKNAHAILIRELYWNDSDKLRAINIINKYSLIPILHNAKVENPWGYYHWSKEFLRQKPDYKGFHGISCHNEAEIQIAEQSGYDYVFLSPIFKTHSHPDNEPLGIKYLENCVKKFKIPIIALGGIYTLNHIYKIKSTNAKGFASIRFFDFP